MKQNHKGKKGEFYYEVDGDKLAVLSYSQANDNKIVIEHTEVDPSLQGQGVGNKLVDAAVAYARKNQIKILPMCSFAAAVFEKEEDYSDVRS